MLVRRKRSNKRKRKFYEAIEFTFSLDIEYIKKLLGDFVYGESSLREVSSFLGDLGKLIDNGMIGAWIETKDGRKICTGQYLLKDDRRKRIISFDQIIFYDWFDIWK